MNHIKNSKARKFIIAATAFVALAVPATANAATVKLHIVPDPLNSNIGGAIISDNVTIASFAGSNGWRPVRDAYNDPKCSSQGAWNDAGNLIYHQFEVRDGHGFFPPYLPKGGQIIVDWEYPNNNGPFDTPVYIYHAGVSCKMVKNVVTYQWHRRNGHRVRVRIVTHIHKDGIGQF